MNTYALLIISGIDAANFLQGQLTCDVLKLQDGETTLAAACNRQGRVVANFWLQRVGENFHAKLPNETIDLLEKHLKKYAVFSKIQFEKKILSEEINYLDLIEKGIALILPATSEQFTPQMIDLQKLGAVSFNKGCYLGQEIVARTEHLGKLKRHLKQIVLDTEKNPGDEIENGVVVNVAEYGEKFVVLAVMRDL